MRVCQNFDAAAIRCNNSPESDVRRSCARFAKTDPLSGDGGDAVLSGRAKHGPVPATRRLCREARSSAAPALACTSAYRYG